MNIQTATLLLKADFSDSDLAWHRFLEVCNRTPYITILSSMRHNFPGGGFSGVVVIGESHAAIHTWPEKRLAWIELATCGNKQAIPAFKRLCRAAFRP